MKKLIPLELPLAAALAALTCSTSFAATLGTDNAAQAPYADGWQTGDDGAATGDGFTPWTLSNTTGTGGSAASGFYIGDSTNVGGADINTSTKSFGMYGVAGSSGTSEANASRSFVAADGTTPTTLNVGQTFSIDLVVNYRDGYKGIDLRDSSNATIFNFNIGGNDYVVNNAATGSGSIGNAYSADTAFHLSFTQSTLTGGTWTITRSGGVTDSDTGTYSGVAQGFHLYVGQTSGTSASDLVANNLAVVPEPGTWAMLAGGLVSLACLRRRRRS